MTQPMSEQDLHALVDDRLDATRRRELEAMLGEKPGLNAHVDAWRAQNRLLHQAFDAVLDEPIPARLLAPPGGRRMPLRVAAALGWLAIGGLLGFYARGPLDDASTPHALARDAALAHAVYAPEVRHPVEVGADNEAHLVAWLSKRLGTELNPPRLDALGFELVGGRLLPGTDGPVAQFMYQDAAGRRLTLYVRTDKDHGTTSFRYAEEGPVSVFYWLDGRLGYALSGELRKQELLQLATAVYRQAQR